MIAILKTTLKVNIAEQNRTEQNMSFISNQVHKEQHDNNIMYKNGLMAEGNNLASYQRGKCNVTDSSKCLTRAKS